jgi:phosphoglycerol geranylgeranyltransferase
MSETVYTYLQRVVKERGAGFLPILDPDRVTPAQAAEAAAKMENAGADALLIGTSLMLGDTFDETIQRIKEKTDIPLVIFPGSSSQISGFADAMLLPSLISGRNPEFLIGQHVQAAWRLKESGLETIPMGYMLVESGTTTSVEFMSGTKPIPRSKPEIAVAHALAGQLLGLKMLFLEAGSGALKPVPDEMIASVKRYVDVPLVVGGGIREPEVAGQKVAAGADLIVVGGALEGRGSKELMQEFARAVHVATGVD